MDSIYNLFLEIFKIPLIKWAIYINLICIAIIGSYNVGIIFGKCLKY